jgi:hypothetical protein
VKRDIKYWDFSDLSLNKANQSWILPQVDSLIQGWPAVSSPGSLWKALGERLDDHWYSGWTKAKTKALVSWLCTSPRGEVVPNQDKHIRHSAPIPLVLANLKEVGVRYESWDWDDPMISTVVDKDVLEMVKWFRSEEYEKIRDLGSDWLSKARTTALEIHSGKNAGGLRNPLKTTSVSHVKFEAPRLAKLALFQFWVFHPTVRHPLMICGPDLDTHPEPLVTDDPFVVETNTHQPTITLDDIWR